MLIIGVPNCSSVLLKRLHFLYSMKELFTELVVKLNQLVINKWLQSIVTELFMPYNENYLYLYIDECLPY